MNELEKNKQMSVTRCKLQVTPIKANAYR